MRWTPIFADSIPGLPLILTALLLSGGWIASPFIGLANLFLSMRKCESRRVVAVHFTLVAFVLLPYLIVYGFRVNVDSLVAKLGWNYDFSVAGAILCVSLIAFGQFRYLLRRPSKA